MSASSGTSDQPVLVVSINGQAQLEYDRSKALPDSQLRYLDRMDEQMNRGVRLGTGWIEQPDALQRAEFVALHLVTALHQENSEATVAASCAYLATRLPDLKQVKGRMVGAGFSIELVFDKPYVPETTVSFVPRQKS